MDSRDEARSGPQEDFMRSIEVSQWRFDVDGLDGAEEERDVA